MPVTINLFNQDCLAMKLQKQIDDDQMCCLKCGHIAEMNAGYELEQPDEGGEEFPICPICGGWNIGGYNSYAEWGCLSDDDQKRIKDLI